MKNITLKLLIICFMIGFGLFFGMDIAHKRMQDSTVNTVSRAGAKPTATPSITEPVSTLAPMTAATARRQAQAVRLQQGAAVQSEEPLIILEDSFVNRLSNAIGEFFRHLATFLVHAVVAFFKFILG